jgi:hypothetical protein
MTGNSKISLNKYHGPDNKLTMCGEIIAIEWNLDAD